MRYEIRWSQPRDGGVMPQTHYYDDLDEAKEFAQGLGADAHAEIFDLGADRPGDAEKPMWSADTPQATEKERDAARAAAVVGKSEGLGGNTKPDTREDHPEDLKELMGNQPKGPDQSTKPMDRPTGAGPAGARQLDADKGGGPGKK